MLWRERYEPLEELGRGGQGRVLRALDHQHDRTVALKVRPAGTDAGRKALLAEARILLGLRPHEGLPLVRDDFFHDDEYVVVMDWVDGIDVGRVLADRGDPGLPLDTVIGYLEPVARALDHLHAHTPAIVHGDVKPANLVLTPAGSVVLVDFGISGVGGYGSPGGSPGFRAPEIASAAAATSAADIYGFAATAYTLLTGRVLDGSRPSWEGLEPTLVAAIERVIRRGLATEPERRPGSATEFLQRLKAVRSAQLPTGVVTFVLTDVEGSTTLWDSHADLMGAVLERHDLLVAGVVEDHSGQLIKSKGEGDSTMSVFARATDAVKAAIEVQRAIAAEPWPEQIDVRVRAAVHTGEAQLRAGDYFGGTVNRGARLRGLAQGGQIFVSQAAAQLAIDTLPGEATLVELGPRELRGLSRDEVVYELVVEGLPSFPAQAQPAASDAAALAMPETRYARSGDIHIAYQVFGEGEVTVVGIPPFVQNVEAAWEHPTFVRLFERFARFSRFVHFDKRGTGLSDREVGAPTFEERMDDMRAVMDAAGVERAVVGGVSEGGPLAMLFAATYPERVSGLILYDTFACPTATDDQPWAMSLEMFEAFAKGLADGWGTPDSIVVPMFAPSMVGDAEYARWSQRYERQAASPGAVTAAMRWITQVDIRGILSSIRVPTLVVHRSGDLVVPVGHGRYLAEHIPGAEYVELEGSDHFPWIGDMDGVLDAFEGFVLRHRETVVPDRVLGTVVRFVGPDRGTVEAVVRRHGGRIDERGTIASFDVPTRAVRAAAEVIDAAADTRVGIHVGELEVGSDRLVGPAVEVTAALVDTAGSGEMIASTTVRDLAMGTELVFTEHGIARVDGRDLPTVALDTGRAVPAPAVQIRELPSVLTPAATFGFVGRDPEFGALRESWDAVASGDRRLVLIAGEPGVGKSRLTSEFARTVHAEDALVLAGRCDEGLAVPYQPFVEALRWFVDHTPDGELRDALGRWPEELVRIVPEIKGRLPELPPPLSSEPETERWRLFEAVGSWLTTISAERPVLLALDDLHWATAPTIQLLRHITRPDADMRVLFVGTYRDTEVESGHPLADALADLRRAGTQTVNLTGLGSDGVEAFVGEAAGHDLDEGARALATAIHDATGGAPLFVGEILRHLVESGALVQRDGRWASEIDLDEMQIPDVARDVIGRRIARLGDDVRRALQVMAVVGEEADLAVLERATDVEDVLSAVEPAVAAGLVREEGAGRFRFAHGLIRRNLYEDVGVTRRTKVHAAVADAIEAVHAENLDDYVATLTHHLLEADDPRASSYASRAGTRALSEYANDEAVRYFTDALRLAEKADDATKCDLLIGLGEAQRRVGDPAYRHTLLGAAALAEQLHDGERTARAVLAMSREWPEMSNDRRALRLLERALDLLPSGDTPLRARTLTALALRLVMAEPDPARRMRLNDEALAMARRLGDQPTIGYVLACRYGTIWTAETLDERLALTDELRSIAVSTGDAYFQAFAYGNGHHASIENADGDACDAGLEEVGRIADEIGQPIWRWIYLCGKGMRALDAGDLERAQGLMDEALEVGGVVAHDAPIWYAASLFALRWEQGRLEELLPLFEQSGGVVATITESMVARMHVELGRKDDALALLRPYAEADFSNIARNPNWLHTMAHWSHVCAELGHQPAAARLYGLLAPLSAHVVVTTAQDSGPVSFYLGLLTATLGRRDEAEEWFAKAVATCEHIRSITWAIRARQEWARMLMSQRTPGALRRARELVEESLEQARELRLPASSERGEKLLAEFPLPAALSGPAPFAFVGRTSELDDLRDAWTAAGSEERHVVLLAGEPGVGKSRLTSEFARTVQADGALVLAGRCDEGLAVPYQPFVEALRWFVDSTPVEQLANAVGRWPGDLIRLVPEIAEHCTDRPTPTPADPETERWRLFEAVASWLSTVSAERPTLLVLDDLHWATEPTVQMLRHISKSDASRLLIVGTYRDTEVSPSHPMAGAMTEMQRGGAGTILLQGLAQQAVGQIVQVADDDRERGLAAAIHAATDGVPLFVGEFVRHLRETGAVVEEDDGRWTTQGPLQELEIPAVARDVIQRRVDRLSEATQDVLRVAAVSGDEAEVAVLETVLEGQDVVSALEEASAAGVVEEVGAGRIRFAHALIRSTIYEAIGATRRSRLHVGTADAIEQLHADDLDPWSADMARHLSLASDPRTADRVVAHSQRAADVALRQNAYEDAVRFLELALSSAGGDEPSSRCELLIRLGESQQKAAIPGFRETLLEAGRLAGSLGDGQRMARAALANDRGLWGDWEGDDDRIAALDAALEAIGAEDSPTRTRLSARLGIEAAMYPEREPHRLSDAALAMARRLGDPRLIAEVLRVRHHTIWCPHTLSEREANAAELAQLAERLSDRELALFAIFQKTHIALERGDGDEAEALAAEMARIATELRRPLLSWLAGWAGMATSAIRGPFDVAEERATEMLRLSENLQQTDAIAWYSANFVLIRWTQGRLDELVKPIARFASTTPLWGNAASGAAYLVRAGLIEEARPYYVATQNIDLQTLPHTGAWLSQLTDVAFLAVAFDDRDRAEELLALLAPFKEHVPENTRVMEACAHTCGMLARFLGRPDEAESYYELAEQIHERLGAVFFLARTRLALAGLRSQQGRRGEATDLATKALEAAETFGMPEIARAARKF